MSEAKKKILLIEDHPAVVERIVRLFNPYKDHVTIEIVTTAKDALERLSFENGLWAVDALILDIMLPYGSPDVRTRLKGEGDDSSLDTGIHLLKYIRDEEANKKGSPLWVFAITGRNAPHVLNRVRALLQTKGRLFVKPFNDFVLENDMALIFGIQSLVDPILLPQDYKPPETYHDI